MKFRMKFKKTISRILLLAMVMSLFTFSAPSILAQNTTFFWDDFESYPANSQILQTTGGQPYSSPNAKWTQTIQGNFTAIYENGTSGNKIGQHGSSEPNLYVTNRIPYVNTVTPTVLSGRIRMHDREIWMDHGGLYWISLGANKVKVAGNTFGKYVAGEWINFTVGIRTTADPNNTKLYAYFSSDTGLQDPNGNAVKNIYVEKSVVQAAKTDLMKFTSSTSVAGTVDLDDIKVEYAPSLDLTADINTNVSSTLRMNFNNPVKKASLTKDHVVLIPYASSQDPNHPYSSSTPIPISAVTPVGNEFCPVDSANGNSWVNGIDIVPAAALEPNTIYEVKLDKAVKDFIGNVSANNVLFSTDSVSPPPNPAADIEVESIQIIPNAIFLSTGFDLPCVLQTQLFPQEGITNPTLNWYSDANQVATVDRLTGNITAVAPGIAKITAKSTDGSNVTSNQCIVTVTAGAVRDSMHKFNITPNERPDIHVADALKWPSQIGDASIALWKGNRLGAFSMSVDDTITADFDQWIAFSKRFGFIPTFFSITSRCGDPNSSYDTAFDFPKMVGAGMDIQSHTKSHYSDVDQLTLSTAQVIEEFGQPIRALNQKSGVNVKTLGYAFGYQGDKTPYDEAAYCRKFYIAARDVTGNVNMPNKTAIKGSQQATDYARVSSASIAGYTTVLKSKAGGADISLEGMVKSLYDGTTTFKGQVNTGGWGVVHCHGLVDASDVTPGTETQTGQVMNTLMREYLKPASDAGKLWVASFTDVAMYGQERDTSTLNVTQKEARLIKFNLTDKMDDSMFDYPLTVRIRIDNSWGNGIKALQNGKSIPATVVTDNSNKYALVDAVPDRGEVAVFPQPIAISEINCNVDGNIINTSFSITNNMEESYQEKSLIVLAAYESNTSKLAKVQLIEQNPPLQSGATINIQRAFTGMNSGTYKVKAMLWDSATGLKALAAPVDTAATIQPPATPTPPPTPTPTPPPILINVAQGKTVTADSSYSTYIAENAVDGVISDTSRWTSASTTAAHWIEINLGNSYNLAGAEIYTGFQGSYPVANFVLQMWNGTAWVDIPGATVTGNSSTTITKTFTSPVAANKVRFYTDDDGYIRVKEIKLLGW